MTRDTEPKSDWMRYAYGYSDKKPSLWGEERNLALLILICVVIRLLWRVAW